jgi:hypothetical protein
MQCFTLFFRKTIYIEILRLSYNYSVQTIFTYIKYFAPVTFPNKKNFFIY